PLLLLITPHPPRSTLFPYTTLFRSGPYRRNHQACIHSLRIPATVALRHPPRSRPFPGRQRPARRAPRRRDRDRPKHPEDVVVPPDRKSTRLNSSHVAISYAVFCLKK